MTVALKKNVAGYVDGSGRFRPIRSPSYIGGRKATAKDKRKYSKVLGGDLGKEKQSQALDLKNEDPWVTESRLESEATEREQRERARIMRDIDNDIYGGADTHGKGRTLLQFVRDAGGIKRQFRHGGKKAFGKRSEWDKGEIDRLSYKETGKRGLTSETKGKTPDKMYQAALESGYDVSSIGDLMQKVEDEVFGRDTTYSTRGHMDYTKENPVNYQGKNIFPYRVKYHYRGGGSKEITVWATSETDAKIVAKATLGGGVMDEARKVNPKKKTPSELLKMQLAAQMAQTKMTAAGQKLGVDSRQYKTAEAAWKTASQRFQRARAKVNPKKTGWRKVGSYGLTFYKFYSPAGDVVGAADKISGGWSGVTENGAKNFATLAKAKKFVEQTYRLARNPARRKKKAPSAVALAKAAISVFDNDLDLDVDMKDVRRLQQEAKREKKNPPGRPTLALYRKFRSQGEPKAVEWFVWYRVANPSLKKLIITDVSKTLEIPSRDAKAWLDKNVRKKNPDAVTTFAQLASGLVSALHLKDMLNRPAKRRSTPKTRKTTARRRNALARRTAAVMTVKKNPAGIQAGDILTGQHVGDADLKIRATVLERKGSFVRVKVDGHRETKRLKVHTHNGEEFIFPFGRHSMAPTIKKRNPGKASNPRIAVIKDGMKSADVDVTKPFRQPANIIWCDKCDRFRRVGHSGHLAKKANPTRRRVVGVAAKKVSDAYYLNPFIDGVYLSHGTDLGRRFATAAAARKYARERNIKLIANPAKAVSKKNPVATKANGIVSRALARRKAAKEYKKELRLKAAAERSRKRREKAEARSRNPVAKKKNPVSVPRRRTFEMFNGRKSENVVAMPISRLVGTGQRIDQLGELISFKLAGEKFERKVNPAKYRLCAKNGKLWIAGGKFAKPDKNQPANVLNPIDNIDYVVYRTHKPHHGDPPEQQYIHKLGEESGKWPTLCVDNEGFPVIRGGAYKIEARGIVD